MADTGTPPAAVAAKRATKRRNLRKRPADDGEGAADAGAAAALDDARALARLRERKTVRVCARWRRVGKREIQRRRRPLASTLLPRVCRPTPCSP